MTVGGKPFAILVAALDTSDDNRVNYDTLVFFDGNAGIAPGPFALPATGPAYVEAASNTSAKFYFEGSSTKAGTAFFVSELAPDLSTVRVIRYGAHFIPRNAAGACRRGRRERKRRLLGAATGLPDRGAARARASDPSAISSSKRPIEDQVRTFVDYQVRVILRAIERNPDADLVMGYIEQPDGAGHQFLMNDPRQPSDFRDATSIGSNQDPVKRERYRRHLGAAYRVANDAIQRIIDKVGVDADGRPRSTIVVVSDHGMAPFHTAVNLPAYLASRGFDPSEGSCGDLGSGGQRLHQPEGTASGRHRRTGRIRGAAASRLPRRCATFATKIRATRSRAAARRCSSRCTSVRRQEM